MDLGFQMAISLLYFEVVNLVKSVLTEVTDVFTSKH